MSLSKIKALGERSQQFHTQLSADLDTAMAKYDDLDKRKAAALAKHAGYLDLVQKDLADAEAAVTHLTNLPLENSSNGHDDSKPQT